MQEETKILGIPLNRIVAFAGPHVSWLAGVIATWLITNVHLLGTFHVTEKGAAKTITTCLVFVMVTALTWLGQSKWLKGHHIELANTPRLAITGDPADEKGAADLSDQDNRDTEVGVA